MVIAHQFDADFNQVIAPRSQVATDAGAQVVFFGNNFEDGAGPVRMNPPVGMLLDQVNGRERRQPEHELHPKAMAVVRKFMKQSIFFRTQTSTIAAKGEIRPDGVAMDDLHAGGAAFSTSPGVTNAMRVMLRTQSGGVMVWKAAGGWRESATPKGVRPEATPPIAVARNCLRLGLVMKAI